MTESDYNELQAQRNNNTYIILSRMKMASRAFLCCFQSALSRDIYLSSVKIVLKFNSTRWKEGRQFS